MADGGGRGWSRLNLALDLLMSMARCQGNLFEGGEGQIARLRRLVAD